MIRKGYSKIAFFLALAAMLTSAEIAAAQTNYFTTVIDSSLQTADLSNRLFQSRMALAASARRRRGGSTSAPRTGGAPSVPARPQPNPRTTFTPVTTDLMPIVFADAAAKTAEQFYRCGAGTDQPYFRMNTPGRRDFLRMLFHYNDLMRARAGGAYVYDVAYAASEMVLACRSVQGGESLAPEQAEGVRAQVRETFENDANFQQLPARKRQQLYETYALVAMFLGEYYNDASNAGDRAVAEQIRRTAQDQLEAFFGAPLDDLSFTAHGVTVQGN